MELGAGPFGARLFHVLVELVVCGLRLMLGRRRTDNKTNERYKVMSTKALVPLTAPTEDVKANAFSMMGTRYNAAGSSLGRRFSFVGGFPAGDVKKALKEADPTLKGKALTAKTNSILRGDVEMSKMYADMLIAPSYRTGFRPVIADLNKDETKLKLTFVKVGEGNLSKQDVADNTKRMLASGELGEAELLAMIEAVKAKKAEATAIEVATKLVKEGKLNGTAIDVTSTKK